MASEKNSEKTLLAIKSGPHQAQPGDSWFLFPIDCHRAAWMVVQKDCFIDIPIIASSHGEVVAQEPKSDLKEETVAGIAFVGKILEDAFKLLHRWQTLFQILLPADPQKP